MSIRHKNRNVAGLYCLRDSLSHLWSSTAFVLPCVQGYGITLGTINGLNMASSILQAIPNLQVQVVTIITWMVARFFMYSRWAGTLQ